MLKRVQFNGRLSLIIPFKRFKNQRNGGNEMARKQKTSPLEDWMELISKLPWWGGIILAVVSFVFLNGLASSNVQATDAGSIIVGPLVKALASIGQFLVPIVCLLGALGSFLRQRNRKSLISTVAQSKAADSLDKMSWHEFEVLVGEAFRLQGYRVEGTGGAGPDGGVDLVLYKGNEKFLVQCKQWKAYKVSVMVVRELYGVMAAKGAAGGFVVTSGRFTSDAIEFAAGRNIKLLDGALLFGMIKQAQAARRGASESLGSVNVSAPQTYRVPACPSCGTEMTRRVAKRGANVGSEFWGCTKYPACTGTRRIDQS